VSSAPCPVCRERTEPAGQVYGKLVQRWFELRHCPTCRYSFVADPVTDYALLYSEAYYTGRGADPMVDYLFELEHPVATVRQYEWRGILRNVMALRKLSATTRWLDFGCGNAGLVRYVRERTDCQIVGFDEGWITQRAAALQLPLISRDELDAQVGMYDIITAIEVLEHVIDPIDTLRQIKRLLKPGGVFFFTTGNAQPFRGRLADWGYVVPEIHVSFFEPETLVRALQMVGFTPTFLRLPGWTDIIHFKMLKTLRRRKWSAIERWLPWGMLAHIVDRRLGVTGHPLAYLAQDESLGASYL
jgi:SAM-dependent methyltransferase